MVIINKWKLFSSSCGKAQRSESFSKYSTAGGFWDLDSSPSPVSKELYWSGPIILFYDLAFHISWMGLTELCGCQVAQWWRIHLPNRKWAFSPWTGKMPWRRAWQPSPVFLPAESHGQRRLAGYSPWGHKESDTTERLTHTHTQTHKDIRVL